MARAETMELSKADLAAIRERFDAVARHISANDYEAWSNDFTADGVFMFMHAPVVRGRKAMREWGEAMPRVDRLTFEGIEIHGGGDTAWGTSAYHVTFQGNPAPDTGKQLLVPRRQADGGWLTAAASVSSDTPLPASGAAGAEATDLGARIRRANDELLGKGNIALAREIFSPNYVVHFDGETLRGPQAVEQYLTELRAAFRSAP